MGKPTGFLEVGRETANYRPVEERVKDWNEYIVPLPEEKKKAQAARCMDCGVPFCNKGCPLGNLIPNWNDLIYRDHWKEAIVELHKTNNFPEFTGRICPAPCESACVLGINDNPVTIKQIEVSIVDRAFEEGWIVPEPPKSRTGKKVAVIGSGPAGLAAAAQLNKAGHLVTVFERDHRIGGLLTLGIPDFKMEKHVVERRVALLEEEGIVFRTNANVGGNISVEALLDEYDAMVLAMGSTAARDVKVPGREAKGIHFAMDYLSAQNSVVGGDLPKGRQHIDAKGKKVVIIGGGDTGADCYGTAIRQGAESVAQIELLPKPPAERPDWNPWPQWPMILHTAPAHKEGGTRDWSIATKSFETKNGVVTALNCVRLEWTNMDRPPQDRKMQEVPGSEFQIPADLVFLAIGFAGPEKKLPHELLGVELDNRGNIRTDATYMTTKPGIFAAGDARRGQSLVVWAIAEGRKAARGCDLWLMGHSDLPG